MVPMMAINTVAGSRAPGAFPKAAMPAGKLNTPAPMILLTKLKISLGMDAVPLPLSFDASDDDEVIWNNWVWQFS